MAERKAKLGDCDAEVAAASAALEQLSSEKVATATSLKRAEHTASRAAATRKDAARAADALLAAHGWLAGQRALLGRAGGPFDFSDPARSPATAKRRLAELQAAQDALSKNINMKVCSVSRLLCVFREFSVGVLNQQVLSMFDKAEREYTDLLAKQRTVEDDREKVCLRSPFYVIFFSLI